MRAIIYARRSSDRQEDSIETQESLCRAHAATQGHTVLRVDVEPPTSGSVPIARRPVASALFVAVREHKRQFDGILVLRMDRLFRNPEEEINGIVYLGKYDCEILSVYDPIDRSTSIGRLYHGIMMAVRAFERELTGDRVRDHNEKLAMSGRWPAGRPPLGYAYDPQTQSITVSERAADAIRVFEFYLSACGNCSAAARALNADGVRSRDGNPWRDDSVLAIVRSPVYRRRIRYDGQEYDALDLIPELVSDETLVAADALLARTAGLVTRQRAGQYAYSGLLVCSLCGGGMKSNGSGSWLCRAKKESGTCDGRSIAERYLDILVGDALQQLVDRLTEALTPHVGKPRARREDRRRESLAERRGRVVESYIEGYIDRAERDRRLAVIQGELAAIDTPARPVAVTQERLAELVEVLGADWGSSPHATRRRVLMEIGARITVCTECDCRRWVELSTPVAAPIRAQLSHKSKGARPRKTRPSTDARFRCVASLHALLWL